MFAFVLVLNMAILDIELPGVEGTKLLTTIHKNLPKNNQNQITRYPLLENAVEALNHEKTHQ